ncbi:glycosyltransferase family 2 protein [Bacillus sp. 1P10SD]|uniref:glycosyltransferase family 2 protein n=1 Tax=Bacillus sp. 1P10SD TaxID=3132265 RepID=UPI0039A5143E
MDILYSVVIPVHNRSEQVLLTLTSFEKQINAKPFEVIVVNDASTDHTSEKINDYAKNAPYPIQVVSLKERKGPAGRNDGIEKANGNYIIFCDADFLVLPNFIETHHKMHQNHPMTVVSGTPYCYRGLYSLYFPNFTKEESTKMKQSLEKNGLWKDSYLKASKVTNILTQEDIRNHFEKVYKGLSIYEEIGESIKKAFLDLKNAPWLLFITRNVSVEKKAFQEVGGFDERLFRGEDWDLGYRLYKKGYKFAIIEKEIGYHQEHPHEYRNPFKPMFSFSKALTEKFGKEDPELFILSLWDSSDDLWTDIPVYKKGLSLYCSSKNSDVESVKYLLKKACQKIE